MMPQGFVRAVVALLFVAAQFFPLVHIAVEHVDRPETCGHENSAHFCTGSEHGESTPCQVCITAQGVNLAEELARTGEIARVVEQPVRIPSSIEPEHAFVHLPRSRGPPSDL